MYTSQGFKIGLISLVAFLAITTAERTYSGYHDLGQYLVKIADKSAEEYCPGALVSPMHVLTSAYCILKIDKGNLVATGGTMATSSPILKRGVAKVIIPKDYNTENMNNDIAVVKLTEAMSGREIQPIELTPQDPQKEFGIVKLVGWNSMGGLYSEHFPIMYFEQCERKMAEFSVTLPKSTTCVQGSSEYSSPPGTPITVSVHGLKLAGVSSWTNVHDRGDRTMGFTKITAVREFIDDAMRA